MIWKLCWQLPPVSRTLDTNTRLAILINREDRSQLVVMASECFFCLWILGNQDSNFLGKFTWSHADSKSTCTLHCLAPHKFQAMSIEPILVFISASTTEMGEYSMLIWIPNGSDRAWTSRAGACQPHTMCYCRYKWGFGISGCRGETIALTSSTKVYWQRVLASTPAASWRWCGPSWWQVWSARQRLN